MGGLAKTTLATLLAAGSALLAAGCGEDEPSGPASLVPPDAPFFAESVIRPEGDRAEAIVELSSRLGGVDDPDRRLVELLDASLEEEGTGLTFADDIDPWLGESGAFFIRSLESSAFVGGMVDAAVIVEVTDADAAQSFLDDLPDATSDGTLEEATYEETDFLLSEEEDTAVGLVEGFMVSGTEDSFKAAVDAAAGESLADAEDFSEIIGELDDDRLAEMWLDLGIVLDAAAESSGADDAAIDAARTALGPLLSEPVAMSLSATTETITLDVSAVGGDGLGGESELLEALPAQAWLGVALSDAGEAVRQTLSGLGSLGSQLGDPSLDPDAIASALEAQTGLDLEDDVLAWIGDLAFYVAGTSEAEFELGTLIEATDSEAAGAAIEAAREPLEQASGQRTDEPELEGAEDGFALTAPTGEGIEVALRDGQLVVSFGAGAAAERTLEPEQTLGDSEPFEAATDALGDRAAVAYVALQDFLVVAEQGDDDGSPDYDAIRPYTQALEYLIAGTASEDERDLTRIVLGVSE